MRQSTLRPALLSALALLVVCATAAASAAMWREVHAPELGQAGALHFVDAQDGWILVDDDQARDGNDLVGFTTQDGGSGWEALRIPGFRSPDVGYSWVTGRGPFCAARLDRQTAWVGGAGLIARTSDAGATWDITHLWPAIIFTRDLIAFAQAGAMNVRGLHFVSATNGFMFVSADSATDGWPGGAAVLATHDGGSTWERWAVSAWPPPSFFRGRRFGMASPSVAWVSHWEGMYLTADAGATWHLADFGVGDGLAAPNGRVWATAVAGWEIASSSDFGRTWTPGAVVDDTVAALGVSVGWSALAFAPDGRGWAVGARGVVLATEDGKTWTREPTPTEARLFDVQYVDGVVYATGEGGVLLRRDGASTHVRATGKRATAWARVKEGR